MIPKIETKPAMKFVGQKIIMSFSENKTAELWKGFMAQKREITNNISTELYSIEIYPPAFFANFNPQTNFEKWAAVKVANFDKIPERMKAIVSPEGLYAVFVHIGLASEVPKTYQYILQNWLPNSKYSLDNRPHFAIMGNK